MAKPGLNEGTIESFISRDLSLLPNDRYGVVALIPIYFELLMRFQIRNFKWPFLGKIRKLGKKLRKGNLIKFLSLNTFLAEFHEEIIFLTKLEDIY